MSLGGVATSTYAIWIAAAFGMTALWALVVVVDKKILESVTPLAVNFFVRLAAIAGLVLITVPLTVFDLWSNGFGLNAEAAGWIALSAVATWLVAFNAYYYALRGERVAVVAPICSTDPIWTALFAWLIIGTAFGGATLAGMAVAMAGVVLISRWMDGGGEAEARRRRRDALARGARRRCCRAEAPRGRAAGRRNRSGPVRRDGDQGAAHRARPARRAGWGLGPVLHRPGRDRLRPRDGRHDAAQPGAGRAHAGRRAAAAPHAAHCAPADAGGAPPAPSGSSCSPGLLEASVSVLFYLSIVAIGPVLTMLIMATTPVFSIVLGVVFLRERPGPRLTLAAAITVAGVLIATLDGLT